MRNVNGTSTIDENCGFDLNLLHCTPTSPSSTGERFLTGKENGKPVLVYHTEGTPSNTSTTTILTPQEVKAKFKWDWDNIPSFKPVKVWVEENI